MASRKNTDLLGNTDLSTEGQNNEIIIEDVNEDSLEEDVKDLRIKMNASPESNEAAQFNKSFTNFKGKVNIKKSVKNLFGLFRIKKQKNPL